MQYGLAMSGLILWWRALKNDIFNHNLLNVITESIVSSNFKEWLTCQLMDSFLTPAGHVPEELCPKMDLRKLIPSRTFFKNNRGIQVQTPKPENKKEIFELATRPDSFYCLINMLNVSRDIYWSWCELVTLFLTFSLFPPSFFLPSLSFSPSLRLIHLILITSVIMMGTYSSMWQ